MEMVGKTTMYIYSASAGMRNGIEYHSGPLHNCGLLLGTYIRANIGIIELCYGFRVFGLKSRAFCLV